MCIAKVHWPPMNKFACKLHGYIVYFPTKFCQFYNINLHAGFDVQWQKWQRKNNDENSDNFMLIWNY